VNSAARDLQIAIDSLALRHQAAEALVRLYHAVTVGARSKPASRGVWVCVAESPTRTVDLVEQSRQYLRSKEGHDQFWTVVVPRIKVASQEEHDTLTQALNVMGSWLAHAMTLLTRDDVDINAAHNKVKHGLAVKPTDDLRMAFSTVAPNSDGTLPLSALTDPTKSADIIDGPSLDYLSRGPKTNGRQQGLELTTLNLKPAFLLTEAWMMATTHAAMFHIAAAKHFGSREAQIAPYPALLSGPTPQDLLQNTVVGIRQPITLPPGGVPLDRPTGVGLFDSFVPLTVNYAGRRSGILVDG
jgi:hypothetical protein